MKIQLKDVLPGELFWHSEEDFVEGNDEDAGKIIDQTKPMWVWVKREPETFTTIDGKPCTPRITLLCFDGEVRGDILEVFGRPNDNRLFVGVLMEEEEMGIVLSAESEATLRQYLLERAGLVAITLEENKDRIVMRNNHEGFVEEIVGLNAQLKKVSESAATTEKPVGVEKYPYHWYDKEFFKGYGKSQLKQFILDQQDQMKMMHDQMAKTIAKKNVKLNEMMSPPEEAKSRVVEINWGEEEGEDSAVQTPVRTEKEIQEPSTPVLMVEARLETLERSITFRKEALANLSEDLHSSRITYLVELRAMDMLKTSLTSLLEDLEELAEPDEQIRQMDLNSKNDF